MKQLVWALVLLLATGCAAMKRTWAFSAISAQDQDLSVEVVEALVTQRTAWVTLRITNHRETGVDLVPGELVMTWDDGTTTVGSAGHFRSRASGLAEAWAGLTGGKARKDLEPETSREIKYAFRQYGRDLRRHPRYDIDLGGLVVDGHAVSLPPLRLTAPPEAPMGEQL